MSKNKNKESNIVVPDSPSELWKEWREFTESQRQSAKAQEVFESLFDDETGEGLELEETVELVGLLLERLREVYFFTVLECGLPPLEEKLWKDDLKSLKKALKSVKALN